MCIQEVLSFSTCTAGPMRLKQQTLFKKLFANFGQRGTRSSRYQTCSNCRGLADRPGNNVAWASTRRPSVTGALKSRPSATRTNVPGAGYRKTGIGGAKQCRYRGEADIPEQGKCREDPY